jgi:cyclopropane fatty-acyl-phospholipid synthase-like methyltransferase
MQKQDNDAQNLYDRTAAVWSRNSPRCLSDLTGREPLFTHLGDLSGKTVLDLGCGEGYCARNYVRKGATSVHGVDISSEMIKLARTASDDAKLSFQCASVDQFAAEKAAHASRYDLATAVFVSNYLDSEQLQTLIEVAYSSIKDGGEFVLLHPHPHLPYLRQTTDSGLRFDVNLESSYFDAIGSSHVGHILDLEGNTIEVRLVHHTLEELFSNFLKSGFVITEFRELRLEPGTAAAWPVLHGVSSSNPMHIMIAGRKK